jgi:hypothetical protein
MDVSVLGTPAASIFRADIEGYGNMFLLNISNIHYDIQSPFFSTYNSQAIQHDKGKGKAIPLQAWTGPESSRRLRLPDFKTVST